MNTFCIEKEQEKEKEKRTRRWVKSRICGSRRASNLQGSEKCFLGHRL
jgi:hypothetical protein